MSGSFDVIVIPEVVWSKETGMLNPFICFVLKLEISDVSTVAT